MPRLPRHRRAPSLILYWEEGRLVAHNYRSGAKVAVSPVIIGFLDAFPNAGTPPEAVARLARHTLIEPRTRGETRPAVGWHDWGALAAAFHFGTKDIRWSTDHAGGERRLRRRARHEPMPPPVNKAPRGAAVVRLPAVERERAQDGEFVRTLLDRRTWRHFGRGPIPLEDIATLLQLTWGVQQWGVVPGQGRVALKTSPSGGACHPGEVYVLAVHVAGLRPGLYHYQADRHRLALVRAGATRAEIGRYLGGQTWYRRASALFLMTAVFAREQWRYATPRAYRTVLLDAGHLCQTFCLTATWLGLAPFCTAALADTLVERALGLDGESEGVLYAAGVGPRPAGGWRPGIF